MNLDHESDEALESPMSDPLEESLVAEEGFEDSETDGLVEQTSFDELDTLAPDQLGDAYKSARTKLSQQGQELHQLQQQFEQVTQQNQQLMAAMQDPEVMQQLAQFSANRSQGPAIPTVETVADKLDLDPDLAGTLASFMQEMGFVSRFDAEVQQLTQQVNAINGRYVDAESSQLQQKYPGADSYMDKARALVAQTQGTIDLESALMAVSKGKLANAAQQTQRKKAAVTAPSSPRSYASGEATKPAANMAEAFARALKKQNMDPAKFGDLRRI